MTISSPFTAAERFESFKAAALGGTCAGMTSVGILAASRLLTQGTVASLVGLASGLARRTLLVNLAIAILSGALFALTYRYAVRQDENPQLKAGVVLAFTLVRGLAQVDAGSAIAQDFWPFLRACVESLLIFGLGAIALDLAIQLRWVMPFGNASIR